MSLDLPDIPLILATRNPKKGRELAELVAPPWERNPRLARLAVRTLDEVRPDLPDVVEDADTFAGNARKKASEIARALGLWALADDSGLAVDALDGAPGVRSARYAGEPSDDAANNRKMLD
jgi:XTP/dITP diphosphohydrolase